MIVLYIFVQKERSKHLALEQKEMNNTGVVYWSSSE